MKRPGDRKRGDDGFNYLRTNVDLDAVVDTVGDTDGRTRDITLLDRLVETLRIGGTMADAAKRCGIVPSVFVEWTRTGNVAASDLLEGRRRGSQLTWKERQCIRFVHATERARADGKAFLLAQAERLARGGIERVETVEVVDGQGQVVERKTKVSTTLPDGAMLRFKLASQYPELNPSRVLEVTGPDGGPVQVESPLTELLAHMERIAENHRRLEPVDTTGRDRDAAALPEGNGHG